MIAISIAGYDPSAGAGILSDIKTFSALGVYGTGIITALTAQNAKRVSGIYPISPEFIEEQIDLVMEDADIMFGKTGMLYSPNIIRSLAKKVKEYQLKMVVDPVMVAGSGGKLSQQGLADSLKKYLLKKSILVTPNIHEAEILSGIQIKNQEDAIRAARKIGKYCDVVITGGHLEGDNIFFDGKLEIFQGELIESNNTHGSGCSFSAAVTAYLVQGFDLKEALKQADSYVKESIRQGHYGTLNQFWNHEI
ncbi:MAG: bifunctional hydroxymethylpyrimidine kinase/phosphomethylpyrimidine kinase [Euryarchaeota archaeon]|nr:bifunctional hydroxymethylpyrimidine kinase/phosphomethylpyrimidine kinase [Euryarchaeota archaeon]MBU4608724.1 bifunctional hydroxymethylpyrimidine kinase/phosphomethylpyrimidine kinase [Euryarchaeota archaeon]MBV1729215.1 bifunctional hydroxymethylpyrimidine kinase/phosphomethylpyrimidine kinase [Methanobacterium sp.]MBV1755577.1 bifunctional hydroxymethylpyrimidine kinase/phosphomethylpyrimidine kinase [Methanobacterium sp.]